MVPAYFVLLDKIPLTPNGKIKRDALPLPQLKDQENKVVPRDEIELKLAALWAEVLDIEKDFVSIHRHESLRTSFHMTGDKRSIKCRN